MIQQLGSAALGKHSWIEYRIGVNLGDVIVETDDVYGGSTLSRLEGIAEPDRFTFLGASTNK